MRAAGWRSCISSGARTTGSRLEAQRALELNPNDPETLADVGHYLAFMGEFERGAELSRRAQRLNPLHPGWYFFSFARLHYSQRRYAEAVADLQRTGMPHFYWTHLLGRGGLGQMGDPEAPAALARIFALKPDFSARGGAAEVECRAGRPRAHPRRPQEGGGLPE